MCPFSLLCNHRKDVASLSLLYCNYNFVGFQKSKILFILTESKSFDTFTDLSRSLGNNRYLQVTLLYIFLFENFVFSDESTEEISSVDIQISAVAPWTKHIPKCAKNFCSEKRLESIKVLIYIHTTEILKCFHITKLV